MNIWHDISPKRIKADDFFDEERMRKIRQWMMKILKK